MSWSFTDSVESAKMVTEELCSLLSLYASLCWGKRILPHPPASLPYSDPQGPFPKELGLRILEYENPYGSKHRHRLERQAGCQEKVLSPPQTLLRGPCFAQGQWGFMGIDTQAQNQMSWLQA